MKCSLDVKYFNRICTFLKTNVNAWREISAVYSSKKKKRHLKNILKWCNKAFVFGNFLPLISEGSLCKLQLSKCYNGFKSSFGFPLSDGWLQSVKSLSLFTFNFRHSPAAVWTSAKQLLLQSQLPHSDPVHQPSASEHLSIRKGRCLSWCVEVKRYSKSPYLPTHFNT